MTTANLAIIIFAAIIAQVAAMAAYRTYRRRREYRGTAASPAADTKESGASGLAWEGFREFKVQRCLYEDTNRSICSYYLAPVDGKPLPPFKPGQFLSFGLEMEDPAGGQPNTLVRCYTLSDAPRRDHYRVSIKRVPAPADQPDAPPGLGSNFFHDRVQEGSRLQVGAPAGVFHLQEGDRTPIVLIGGGIGITPMLSMLNAVLESGSGREVWLFYGVRNGAEQIMKGHLKALAAAHENFHLHLCYSAPDGNDVEGVDYQHQGRVDIALLQRTLKPQRHQFYLCGPGSMLESLVPALEQWGVDSGDIHYESFGPSTLRRPQTNEADSAEPVTVTFSESGVSLPWDPAAASLLEFAEANGIEVHSGCRAGCCGGCQTVVSGGEVAYNADPVTEITPGHCLLCISIPKSDLTLTA